MKVIGIKGNYNNCPEIVPSVYLMADSSLLKDGKPLFLPNFANDFIAYPALVVRINRLGKNIAKRFASRYYDAVTVGLCLEANNITPSAKLSCSDSLINAFDGAAVLGDFIPIEDFNNEDNHIISVTVNNNEPLCIDTNDLTLDIDSLIEELSKYYTFKIGDILYTGYNPNTGFKLNINDSISCKLGNAEPLHFKVK